MPRNIIGSIRWSDTLYPGITSVKWSYTEELIDTIELIKEDVVTHINGSDNIHTLSSQNKWGFINSTIRDYILDKNYDITNKLDKLEIDLDNSFSGIKFMSDSSYPSIDIPDRFSVIEGV